MKTLKVVHGQRSNPQVDTVQLNGVDESKTLYPSLARQAARIGAGHLRGVTVIDETARRGYRFYSEKKNSHRKVVFDDS